MAVRKIKSTGIRAPDGNPKNHEIVLSQLKEVAEVGQRLRGNPLDSFVRVNELVDAGVLRVVDGEVITASTLQAILDAAALAAALALKADKSTQVIAGAGLTGGGDLSANRTVDVGAGTGITVNANDVALSAATITSLGLANTSVQPARTLTAGAGLTGGGDLSANRTFDVGAGTGITVNANDIQIASAYQAANPSGLIGMAAVNGVATSPLRSDGRHAIDPAISPTWTNTHVFRGDTGRGGTTTQLSVGTLAGSYAILTMTSGAAGTDKKTTEFFAAPNGDYIISTSNEASSTGREIFRAVRGTGIAVSSITLGNTTDNPPVQLVGDNQELQLGVGRDLHLYHDGTNSIIQNDTGVLHISGAGGDYYRTGAAGTTRQFGFRSGSLNRWRWRCTSGAETGADAGSDFQWLSSHDDGTSFMTVVSILRASGNFLLENDNQELNLGAGRDLRLYHDGSNSWMRTDVGYLGFSIAGNESFRVLNGQARITTTTARGSGLCYAAFYDPTGEKGYFGFASGGSDDLFFINELNALMRLGTNNVELLRLDSSATANDMRLLLYDVSAAALVRVSRGAADSGGAGFRLLRIPN